LKEEEGRGVRVRRVSERAEGKEGERIITMK
jgi:hypothetical protein